MRLLNTIDYSFSEHYEPEIPEYAILSHRWERDEVTFHEVRDHQNVDKAGWIKVKRFCQFALEQGDFQHVWIDTCCIDKTSSAELTEAINSMYRWYEQAKICYAYLFDVRPDFWSAQHGFSELERSEWFTRGWTLQELLAPAFVEFIANDWTHIIGSKSGLASVIESATGIEAYYISDRKFISEASIAERMSWASSRKCTRQEDIAYCLLGFFGVEMPLLYGEGAKAFMRLQLEIIKVSNDESIFAWKLPPPTEAPRPFQRTVSGLFATSPAAFKNSNFIRFLPVDPSRPPYIMTHKGLLFEALATTVLAPQNPSLVPEEGLKGQSIMIVPLNCSLRKTGQAVLVALSMEKMTGSNFTMRLRPDIALGTLFDMCQSYTTDSRKFNRVRFYIWQPGYQQDLGQLPYFWHCPT